MTKEQLSIYMTDTYPVTTPAEDSSDDNLTRIGKVWNCQCGIDGGSITTTAEIDSALS